MDRDSLERSTLDILKTRVREYERSGNSEHNQQRLAQLLDLLKIEGEPRPQLKIFLSYDTERPDLRSVVSQKIRNSNSTLVSGDVPDDSEGRSFRDVIIKRIRSCDGFIGVWTRRKNRRASPWLLWELAIAQAYELPFRLLLEDGIDPQDIRNINPEQLHYSFKEIEFPRKSGLAVRKLVEHIKENHRKKSD